MVAFQSLTNSILLAVCYASAVSALATRNPHLRKRDGTPLPGFSRKSAFQVYGSGKVQPPTFAAQSVDEAAKSFVQRELSLRPEEVTVTTSYTEDTVKNAYLSQQHNGVPFANAVANVAMRNNKVVAFGHSFVNSTSIADSEPKVSQEDAIKAAEEHLEGTYNGHPVTLEYLVKDDGSVALTHVIQTRNKEAGTWYEGFIDAHSGELLGVVSFRSDAAYHVLPIQHQSPDQGEFELLTDPQDLEASPWGWHSVNGGPSSGRTTGNNIHAYVDSDRFATVEESASGDVYDYDLYTNATEPAGYLNTSVTNAFYLTNTIHDIAYRYGFTAYNFQKSNADGSVGKANDEVVVSVHNSSGFNNAFMYTPADGQQGEIAMFLWDTATPTRDGSLSNDILVHEYTHGITNRMTGGGTGRCLQIVEAGGLGEGWSDALAIWTEHQDASTPDVGMGLWATNDPVGIRQFKYSTDKAVNPWTYNSLLDSRMTGVHSIGEVWSNMLYNVYAALVEEHGWSATAKTDPSGSEGNVVWLHLFLDALKLQPCQAEFVTARAAWIQADQNRYNGSHKCLLWKAFASRGLGPNADDNYVDDFSVPADCE